MCTAVCGYLYKIQFLIQVFVIVRAFTIDNKVAVMKFNTDELVIGLSQKNRDTPVSVTN